MSLEGVTSSEISDEEFEEMFSFKSNPQINQYSPKPRKVDFQIKRNGSYLMVNGKRISRQVNRGNNLTIDQIEKVYELYRKTGNKTQTADKLGLCRKTVDKYLRLAGLD